MKSASTPPLRVAILARQMMRVGGTEIYVRRAVDALLARGHDVTVIVKKKIEDHGVPAPVHVHAGMRDALSPSALLKKRKNSAHLCDVLSEFDVAIGHGIYPLDVAHALEKRNAPVARALVIHSGGWVCPSGARYLPKSKTLCTISPGAQCLVQDQKEGCLVGADGSPFPLSQMARAPLLPTITRESANAMHHVIYNSKATKKDFEKHIGVYSSDIVNPPLTSEEARGEKRVDNRLAFVGRLVDVKGCEDALEVLARIPEASLEIFGDGPARSKIEEKACALGVRSRTIFRGWVRREDVAAGLERASCLLVPSVWFEAFGQVGPQAIQAGCPQVAYDTGGISDWCDPSTGTLVPHGDVEAMAKATQIWLKKMREGLNTTSWRKRAQTLFGEERFQTQYARAVENTFANAQKKVAL